jgi:hypothetical protein
MTYERVVDSWLTELALSPRHQARRRGQPFSARVRAENRARTRMGAVRATFDKYRTSAKMDAQLDRRTIGENTEQV